MIRSTYEFFSGRDENGNPDGNDMTIAERIASMRPYFREGMVIVFPDGIQCHNEEELVTALTQRGII